MKKFFFLLFLFIFPAAALAHEKWFVGAPPLNPGKPLLFSQWNSANASMVLLAVFALLAVLLVHVSIRSRPWVRRMRTMLGRWNGWTALVVRTLTGLLLFSATYSRFLFAPDLQTAGLPVTAERVLLAVQLLAGLGLVLGVFPRFMSLLGATLYLLALGIFPFFSVLDYVSFAGLFAYIFIVSDPALPKVRGLKLFPAAVDFFHLKAAQPYAMAVLRIFAGWAILLVGFKYKLLEPAYALEFVRTYGVNFMPALGFERFSDEYFVLAAGLTETLLGAMVIFGLLPRLTGFVLLLCFTLTLGLFGIYELLGHLPFFAVAFALVVNGGGQRWSCESAVPKVRTGR